MKKKIVVLTGAGMSAESGLKTFRDAGGLWEGHDVQKVATPEAWVEDPELVLKFYNERRKQLKTVSPNEGHISLTHLEKENEVIIITQNVDNLHERAGSKNIIHLHGQLTQVRSSSFENLVYDWEGDLNIGDLCERGNQLRPHIVWFGESVPMLEQAIYEISDANIAIIIGTSMQVYPAASLIGYAPKVCKTYYIDPNPHISYELNLNKNLTIIKETATIGVPKVLNLL